MFAARRVKPSVRLLVAAVAVVAGLLVPAGTAGAQEVCTPEWKPGFPPQQCYEVTGVEEQVEWALETVRNTLQNLPVGDALARVQATVAQKIDELGSGGGACVGGPGGPICVGGDNPVGFVDETLCNLDTGPMTNPWQDAGNCYYRR